MTCNRDCQDDVPFLKGQNTEYIYGMEGDKADSVFHFWDDITSDLIDGSTPGWPKLLLLDEKDTRVDAKSLTCCLPANVAAHYNYQEIDHKEATKRTMSKHTMVTGRDCLGYTGCAEFARDPRVWLRQWEYEGRQPGEGS